MVCTQITAMQHKRGVRNRSDCNFRATRTSRKGTETEKRREEKVTSGGGSGRDRARDDGAYARGRTARGRERGWPTTSVHRVAAYAHARKPHSDASRKLQSRHRRPRPGPGRSWKSFCQHLEHDCSESSGLKMLHISSSGVFVIKHVHCHASHFGNFWI